MPYSAKHKILIDLLPALDGFAGIPQESRLLFKILSELQSEAVVGGLIYSNKLRTTPYKFSKVSIPNDNIIAANYLDDLLRKDNLEDFKKLGRLSKLLDKLNKIKYLFFLAIRRKFTIKKIDTNHFFGLIWRVLFAKTLQQKDFNLLKDQQYFISDLNTLSIKVGAALNTTVKLKTKNWDFAIFQFQRAVTLSPGTKKIIRYHDSIAFQDIDVTVSGNTYSHTNDLKGCIKDAFYVCNSEPTREELCKLVPELTARSATIPPIIANYTKVLDRAALLAIIRRSFSSALLTDERQKIVSDQLEADKDFRYIMILSTLEPRKNHVALIRAWEKLRAEKNSNIKLMIVGGLGWKYDDILAHMKPHVQDGNILHLEKIPPIDMGYLYSHAEAFVFPSFNEGFGSPPLEAMQCDCPVIASDIKTHRWVYGEAALYCDPYDVNSILMTLNELLYQPASRAIKTNLIEKGREQVKLYSEEHIKQQWLQLLNRLSAN